MAGHEHPIDATVEAGALHEVVDGVFAWVQPDGSWWVNNSGAVTGADGTIVIDTCCTEARTRRFLDAVAEATDDVAVRFAANTHHHGDHTYGNSLLPKSTVLFGHEQMRSHLLADFLLESGCPEFWSPVPEWGAVTRRVPDVTIRSDLTIFSGDRRVELLHPGYTAHTAGDLIAWLPEERVLFSGDLIFSGLTPLVFQGSVDGALRTLDWLAGFDPSSLVPGHGPLVPGSELAEVLGAHERYYRFILDTARRGQAEGFGPLEAARSCDLGNFAGWADAERLVLNLHRAYADQIGEEMDIVQAFLDAMAWNGGPLTTHVCCVSP